MKLETSCKLARRERGGAAVEFALILPILVLVLALPLFFGRAFWHYSVAQRAAHDAARYLATVSQADMLTPAQGGGDTPAAVAARDIVATETAWLNPGPYAPEIYVQCDGLGCTGHKLPKKVRIAVRVYMYDEFFGQFTSGYTGTYGLELLADVTVPYAGN
jgi:Flp pilus assembly protein TadG